MSEMEIAKALWNEPEFRKSLIDNVNLWVGFAGALLGAIIGLIGSVLGGILGARCTYALQLKMQKATAKKLLLAQLEHSYNLVGDNDHTFNFGLRNIIYDRKWNEHLPYIDELTDDEINIISDWFGRIEKIENFVGKNDYIPGELVDKEILNSIKPIKAIIDKLSK